MRHCATSLPATPLAAGLISGCGGSNDNGTTTTAALTKAQLVQRANAICKQVIQKDHRAQESLGQSPTVAQVRAAARGVRSLRKEGHWL